MMVYLHRDLGIIGPESVIEISLDKQANVRLLEHHEFAKYDRGDSYEFRGGLALVSPVKMAPPHRGHWHVVVDLEGYDGSVQASLRVIR
jgi:hypothetical protein